jgi:hypothetical protein
MQMNGTTGAGRRRVVLTGWLAVTGLAAAAFLVQSPAMPSASGTTATAIPAPAVDEPASGHSST